MPKRECPRCDGGWLTCTNCGIIGKKNCKLCEGKGEMKCSVCDGTGYING